MKATVKTTIAIIGVCAMLCQWASAQIIIRHSGANNPLSEGFNNNGGGAEGTKYATNDNGTLAWVINDTNAPLSSGFGYLKNFTAPQKLQLMQQWRVGWGFKLVDESGNYPFYVQFVQTNSTGGNRDYQVYYDRTNGNDLAVALYSPSGTTLLTLPGAAIGFHSWDLIRTNPASDFAQFYYDNTFVANFSGYNNPGQPGIILWGTTPNNTTSLVEWNSLFVEVPEPSALGVITIVTGIGLLRRRRK